MAEEVSSIGVKLSLNAGSFMTGMTAATEKTEAFVAAAKEAQTVAGAGSGSGKGPGSHAAPKMTPIKVDLSVSNAEIKRIRQQIIEGIGTIPIKISASIAQGEAKAVMAAVSTGAVGSRQGARTVVDSTVARNLPKRAGGGPVYPGSSYLVGEHRPEVFRPASRGTIIPDLDTLRRRELEQARRENDKQRQHELQLARLKSKPRGVSFNVEQNRWGIQVEAMRRGRSVGISEFERVPQAFGSRREGFTQRRDPGVPLGQRSIPAGEWYPGRSEVVPGERGRGIASWMYAEAERHLGDFIRPSDIQSYDARRLWGSPRRPFGGDPDATYGQMGMFGPARRWPHRQGGGGVQRIRNLEQLKAYAQENPGLFSRWTPSIRRDMQPGRTSGGIGDRSIREAGISAIPFPDAPGMPWERLISHKYDLGPAGGSHLDYRGSRGRQGMPGFARRHLWLMEGSPIGAGLDNEPTLDPTSIKPRAIVGRQAVEEYWREKGMFRFSGGGYVHAMAGMNFSGGQTPFGAATEHYNKRIAELPYDRAGFFRHPPGIDRSKAGEILRRALMAEEGEEFYPDIMRESGKSRGGPVRAQRGYAAHAARIAKQLGGTGRITVTPLEERMASRARTAYDALHDIGLTRGTTQAHREFYDLERQKIEAEAAKLGGGVTGKQLVDVVAALSSNQPWESNVEAAIKAIAAVQGNGPAGFANREQLDITSKILSGQRVTGIKRMPFADAFYDPNAFPIDRWMGRITTLGMKSGIKVPTDPMEIMRALRSKDWIGQDVPQPSVRRASIYAIEQAAGRWGMDPREAQAEPWGIVRELNKEAVGHFRLDKKTGLAVPRAAGGDAESFYHHHGGVRRGQGFLAGVATTVADWMKDPFMAYQMWLGQQGRHGGGPVRAQGGMRLPKSVKPDPRAQGREDDVHTQKRVEAHDWWTGITPPVRHYESVPFQDYALWYELEHNNMAWNVGMRPGTGYDYLDKSRYEASHVGNKEAYDWRESMFPPQHPYRPVEPFWSRYPTQGKRGDRPRASGYSRYKAEPHSYDAGLESGTPGQMGFGFQVEPPEFEDPYAHQHMGPPVDLEPFPMSETIRARQKAAEDVWESQLGKAGKKNIKVDPASVELSEEREARQAEAKRLAPRQLYWSDLAKLGQEKFEAALAAAAAPPKGTPKELVPAQQEYYRLKRIYQAARETENKRKGYSGEESAATRKLGVAAAKAQQEFWRQEATLGMAPLLEDEYHVGHRSRRDFEPGLLFQKPVEGWAQGHATSFIADQRFSRAWTDHLTGGHNPNGPDWTYRYGTGLYGGRDMPATEGYGGLRDRAFESRWSTYGSRDITDLEARFQSEAGLAQMSMGVPERGQGMSPEDYADEALRKKHFAQADWMRDEYGYRMHDMYAGPTPFEGLPREPTDEEKREASIAKDKAERVAAREQAKADKKAAAAAARAAAKAGKTSVAKKKVMVFPDATTEDAGAPVLMDADEAKKLMEAKAAEEEARVPQHEAPEVAAHVAVMEAHAAKKVEALIVPAAKKAVDEVAQVAAKIEASGRIIGPSLYDTLLPAYGPSSITHEDAIERLRSLGLSTVSRRTRAAGGEVGNGLYLVNELGPEAFIEGKDVGKLRARRPDIYSRIPGAHDGTRTGMIDRPSWSMFAPQKDGLIVRREDAHAALAATRAQRGADVGDEDLFAPSGPLIAGPYAPFQPSGPLVAAHGAGGGRTPEMESFVAALKVDAAALMAHAEATKKGSTLIAAGTAEIHGLLEAGPSVIPMGPPAPTMGPTLYGFPPGEGGGLFTDETAAAARAAHEAAGPAAGPPPGWAHAGPGGPADFVAGEPGFAHMGGAAAAGAAARARRATTEAGPDAAEGLRDAAEEWEAIGKGLEARGHGIDVAKEMLKVGVKRKDILESFLGEKGLVRAAAGIETSEGRTPAESQALRFGFVAQKSERIRAGGLTDMESRMEELRISTAGAAAAETARTPRGAAAALGQLFGGGGMQFKQRQAALQSATQQWRSRAQEVVTLEQEVGARKKGIAALHAVGEEAPALEHELADREKDLAHARDNHKDSLEKLEKAEKAVLPTTSNVIKSFGAIVLSTSLYGAAFSAVSMLIEKAAVPALGRFVDELTGWQATSTKVTSAIGEQIYASHGNIAAVKAQTAVNAGLSASMMDYVGNAVEASGFAKAGAKAQHETSDLFRTTLRGGAAEGLYGGYGGLFGTSLLGTEMGGGKGFTEQIREDLGRLGGGINRGGPAPNFPVIGNPGEAPGNMNMAIDFLADRDYRDFITKQGRSQGGMMGAVSTIAEIPGGLGDVLGGAADIVSSVNPFGSQNPILSGLGVNAQGVPYATEAEKHAISAVVPEYAAPIMTGATGAEKTGVTNYLADLNKSIDRGAEAAKHATTAHYGLAKSQEEANAALNAAVEANDKNGIMLAEQGIVLRDNTDAVIANGKAYQQTNEDAVRGKTIIAADVWAGLQARALEATKQANAVQTQRTMDLELPFQMTKQLWGQPIVQPGLGFFPGAEKGRPSAAAAGMTGPAARAAQGLFSDINKSNVALQNLADEGLAAARADIEKFLTPTDLQTFNSAVKEADGLSASIAGMTTKMANLNRAASQASWANQLRLANRALGDAIAMQGKAGGERLGYLQREEHFIQRAQQALSLALQQRQITTMIALAQFQAPGETGEERYMRQKEKLAEASIQQRQLNLAQQDFQVAGKMWAENVQRAAVDAAKAIGVMEKARNAEGYSIIAQEAIAKNSQRLGHTVGRIDALVNQARGNFGSALSAATSGVGEFAGAVSTAIDEIYKALGYDRPGDEKKPHGGARRPSMGYMGRHAAGRVPAVGGGAMFTVGEAGPETVAILRNPRTHMLEGGGGGGGAPVTININGPVVRKDEDIAELARCVAAEVERSLSRKGQLLGLRAPAY